MSVVENQRYSTNTIIIDTDDMLSKLERTMWGLHDCHWDIEEILKTIFDAITQYGHKRPEYRVVDIRFDYTTYITNEIIHDTTIMSLEVNALGLSILQYLKRLNAPIDGITQYVYAGRTNNDILIEIRRPV